jgi:hypothetical protein
MRLSVGPIAHWEKLIAGLFVCPERKEG